jgi:glycosyltransferase involved in cell wall biosynthesis
MKIAFFHNLPTGGAKRVAYQQVAFLSLHNDVDVYQLVSKQDAFDFSEVAKNVYDYSFQLPARSGWYNRLVKDYRNFFSLAKIHKKIAADIDKKKYDFVIVHPDWLTQAPYLLPYVKTTSFYYCEELLRIAYEPELAFKGYSNVLKKGYEYVTRSIRKNIDRTNARKATWILANSQYTAENIRKAYKRTAIVSYPGVDTNIFKQKKEKKQYDILFIGEQTTIDGYDLLCESVELFQEKPTLKILSRKNGKLSLSDIDLAAEYNKARAVVCLSFNEPFGLIPLEAMSCGTPVVALDEGGYKETIIHEKVGYLVKRRPEDLYEHLKKLLSNEALLQEMSTRAVDHIQKKWQLSVTARKFQQVLVEQMKVSYEKK